MDFSGQVLKLTLNDFELFPTTAYRYMYRVSQNVLRHIFIHLKDQDFNNYSPLRHVSPTSTRVELCYVFFFCFQTLHLGTF